jgi:uncharacterized protein YndB with AHSA1/START domain
MQKLHVSIFINAPREKVWNTMLNKETYTQWTQPFCPSSTYTGDWSEGSKMLFLGTDSDGNNEGGMVSRIAKNIPYEYVSIEHLGILRNGVEDTTSDEARSWSPAFENYTFTQENDGTRVSVDMDIQEKFQAEFETLWQKSLEVLKEIAER